MLNKNINASSDNGQHVSASRCAICSYWLLPIFLKPVLPARSFWAFVPLTCMKSILHDHRTIHIRVCP